MTLAHGDPLVMIPGPSVIPDRVLRAMSRPMPNIYRGAIVETIDQVLRRLPPVARSSGRAYVAVSNGHGAWEMALTNTLSRGDHVLVAEGGQFATSWATMLQLQHVTHQVVAAPDGCAVRPADVHAALEADTDRRIKAVLVAHVDTATSVRNDLAALRAAIDAANHPALLMVDAVASLGCEPYEMDAWGIDITVAATQKGLMVPPGLGIVLTSDKALAAHQSADLRTGYWDFTARTDPSAHYWIFCGTPPANHLWALTEALDMIDEEGLENVWDRHEAHADAVRAAVEAWETPGGLSLRVVEPAARANSVTVVRTGGVDSTVLQSTVESEAGLTLGIGIGPDDGSREFRIGHMGHVNPPMLLGALGTIEAGLAAMGAPVGASGVAAAAASLAEHIKPAAPIEGASIVMNTDN